MRVNYPQLFTDHHVATLHEWLLETRELYVHDELPHSGGDGRSYLVRSLRDVKRLVSSITHNEVEIFICRNLQLPVRAACSMYARAITDGMALADADAFAAYATMRASPRSVSSHAWTTGTSTLTWLPRSASRHRRNEWLALTSAATRSTIERRRRLRPLGAAVPDNRLRAIELVHAVHDAFVLGRGVFWKMREDVSGPYPGFGLGAMDAFDGYVSYRTIGRHRRHSWHRATAAAKSGRTRDLPSSTIDVEGLRSNANLEARGAFASRVWIDRGAMSFAPAR
jgi:hypothetical protein